MIGCEKDMGRKKKEKRIKKQKKIEILMLFIILGLTAVLGVTVYKGFVVKKVIVEAPEIYPEETIRSWILDDEYSWNTLYVFLKYRFRDAEEMPFLEQPSVTIRNPNVLCIRVEAKEMAGYLYIPSVGQNAYFNKEGIVVETSSEKIGGIMEVTGLDCGKVKVGEKIPLKNKSMLKSMLALTQGLNKHELLPDRIRCDEFSNMMLEYGPTLVNFGDSKNMEGKLNALAVIFPKIQEQNGTLHMENWSEKSTDIPFEKSKDS